MLINNKYANPYLIILAGVLLGAPFAALFATGHAPLINTIFLPMAVIALVFSVALIYSALTWTHRRCLFRYLPLALSAALVLLTVTIIAMTTVVLPTVIPSVILVFLIATMFFILLIGLFFLIQCIIVEHRDHDRPC